MCRPVMTLDSKAGELTAERATGVDYEAVMAILREAADWLSAYGQPRRRELGTERFRNLPF